MNDALPVSAKSLDRSLIKTLTTSKWENARKRNYLSTPPDPPTFRYFYTPSHLPTWTNFPSYFFPPSSPETPDPLDTTNPPEHPDHLTHQIYLTCSYGPLDPFSHLTHLPTWPTWLPDPSNQIAQTDQLLPWPNMTNVISLIHLTHPSGSLVTQGIFQTHLTTWPKWPTPPCWQAWLTRPTWLTWSTWPMWPTWNTWSTLPMTQLTPWPTQLSYLTHLFSQKCQTNMFNKKNWKVQQSVVTWNWHQHPNFSLN
jgi:hypothetical protein